MQGNHKRQWISDKDTGSDICQVSPQDISLIKELGATAVRLTHYQHDQRFYDPCNEREIILWAELPLIKLPTNTTMIFKNAKEQQMELIRQNFNHPSIVFWGNGNKQDSADGASDALLRLLAINAHAEDLSR
jgi:beta-galactosidase